MSFAVDLADSQEARAVHWPWYWSTYDEKLTEEGSAILESCGVPEAQQSAHILSVRDMAWQIFPFPCIGQFWFIEFGLSHHPRFSDLVALLKSSPQPPTPILLKREKADADITDSSPLISNGNVISNIRANPLWRRHLDIGTCVGQDLRILRHRGAPAATLYGTDVFANFERIGHELFRDSDTFSNRFFQADALADDPNSPLHQTRGLWDGVSATMMLHQFDLPEQIRIAERMVALLRLKKGSILLGSNTGQLKPGRNQMKPPLCREGEERWVYRQSKESLAALFAEICDRVGGGRDKWRVECEYDLVQLEKRTK